MNVNLNPAGPQSPIAIHIASANAPASPAADSSATAAPEPAVAATPSSKGKAAAAPSGGTSPEVQILQKLIERLQKQLAQQQLQLRAAMSGDKGKDPANMPRIAALQSVVSTTMGQLADAVAKLAAALVAAGGGSSGNLVSATA